MLSSRSSGILMHVTSLPGRFGIGDIGPEAYAFADFLHAAGQTVWQVLPLVPVGHGNSPYSSPSTFAGNPMLISPERLCADGLLTEAELAAAELAPTEQIEWAEAMQRKQGLIDAAFARLEDTPDHPYHDALWHYAGHESPWLDDYALFRALTQAHGAPWTSWPHPLRTYQPDALAQAREQHARAIKREQFVQMVFARQWQELRAYCKPRGIRILGDLPIYVAHDSADVWADQGLFRLDDEGQPYVVAGVPPDYFSADGQRWGNPLYRWDVMAENDYAWWTRRMQNILRQVDAVRLDHFRAFAGYWEIPASEPTAKGGHWETGPGAALFDALLRKLGTLPVVAEDLGEITPDVPILMQQFDFPGMAVLQFAFGGDASHAFLPHNYVRNVVAYTGTHDNDTLAGWWKTQQDNGALAQVRAHAASYVGADDGDFRWGAIRMMAASVARSVILPMQDALGLGNEARMNTPGEAEGNWAWRMTSQPSPQLASDLRRLMTTYGRCAPEPLMR